MSSKLCNFTCPIETHQIYRYRRIKREEFPPDSVSCYRFRRTVVIYSKENVLCLLKLFTDTLEFVCVYTARVGNVFERNEHRKT